MALVVGTNSYGSRAEADTYFADTLRNAAWAANSTADKDLGLIEATRQMERQDYRFAKVNTLAFPMADATDCQGNDLSEAETLVQGKEAQFELAAALLADRNLLTTTSTDKKDKKKVKAGSVEIEFFHQHEHEGTRFPAVVTEILRCFLVTVNAMIGKKRLIGTSVVTGNCDKTQFESGRFDIIRGFD